LPFLYLRRRSPPSPLFPYTTLFRSRHFLARVAARTRRNVTEFEASAEQALCSYSWPGNVRELGNTIERAVLLKREGRLSASDLRSEERRVGEEGVCRGGRGR